MEEPWTGIVSDEAYCHVVCSQALWIATNANNVSTDRISIVICARSCTSNDIEGVLGCSSDIYRQGIQYQEGLPHGGGKDAEKSGNQHSPS